MCGAGGWVELADGWSWGMGGAQEGFFCFPEFLFFIPCIFCVFGSVLLCAAIMVEKRFSLAILMWRRGHISTLLLFLYVLISSSDYM